MTTLSTGLVVELVQWQHYRHMGRMAICRVVVPGRWPGWGVVGEGCIIQVSESEWGEAQ
jgi:hypothetical protein